MPGNPEVIGSSLGLVPTNAPMSGNPLGRLVAMSSKCRDEISPHKSASVYECVRSEEHTSEVAHPSWVLVPTTPKFSGTPLGGLAALSERAGKEFAPQRAAGF